MLRLFIAEHYYTVYNMQPFERDRQELCVVKKTRQAAVTLLKKSKC